MLAFTMAGSTVCDAQVSKYIRVAINQDASSLSLKIHGSYEIINCNNQKVLSIGRNIKATVTAYKDGILIGDTLAAADKIFIKVKDPGALIINDRMFKGDIQFIKKANGCILVINYLELEDYIKGILYHEVSHYWPKEALKAQAVVCRSYAVYQIQENRLKDYDVTCDVYSQVYGGRTSERYRTNKAVDETKGEIIVYQGRPFCTYYHATCAGKTEDASTLWNINILPLKGVVCNFCKESPHFRWHLILTKDKVKSALIKSGYTGFKDIKDIIILVRNKSGRVADLKIITDTKEIKISGKEFRNLIGPNILRSTNFSVKLVNHDFVFEGLGWGHGVGLCQWGAYFMAKQGYNYKQILRYYYPGSDVETLRF